MNSSMLFDATDRLARTRLLFGKEALDVLQRSRVTVIGLGAVGGQAVEALARAGVGSFRIVDFDQIRLTNINRHIWATQDTVGRSKVVTAFERLKAIDPGICVEPLEMFSAEDTLDRILDNTPDIVIDAIDSLNPKVQTLCACYRKKLRVVSSMGAATRTDPLKIRVADLFETRVCPLAARLRRRLKDLHVGKGITCVYSEEHQDVHALSLDESLDEEAYKRGRPRRTLGSSPTITGIFGLTIAHIAINFLTGKTGPDGT